VADRRRVGAVGPGPCEALGVEAYGVLMVLDALASAGVDVWLDGGWGVDALVGRQTRPHSDVDLVVAREALERAAHTLAALGFRHDPRAVPGLPARHVLDAGDGREVDLHVVVLDGRGDGWQLLDDGAWGAYPAEGFTGVGMIGGRRVRCVTPQLQLRHHLGYPPDETDRHDLRLLAEHFRLNLPPGL
jgi:lincosamide nucleotidyltransferase A/C/D/E